MGGRGTVANYRYKAVTGTKNQLSSSDTVTVTKNVRGKRSHYDSENNTLAPKVIRVGHNQEARLTKKESLLVARIQEAIMKGNNHSIIQSLPKGLKINQIHVEDRVEWYMRNRAKELKGVKDPYNINKDTPIILKKNKNGGTTLVLTWSASQQGVKTLSNRYKSNKGVARNIEEAVLREQAKLVYANLKRTNPKVYNSIHSELMKSKNRPTSKSAGRSMINRGSTTEAFADAYVLNSSKRKNSLGKKQRTVVRGAMHWLGDRNFNRKSLGTTTRLQRIEDKARKRTASTDDRYQYFIRKYTTNKR